MRRTIGIVLCSAAASMYVLALVYGEWRYLVPATACLVLVWSS